MIETERLIPHGRGEPVAPLVAAVEAGGTKMLCVVASGGGEVLAQVRIATGEPDATFAAMAAFFAAERQKHGPVRAGGIASFGPLDLDRGSPHYGRLTTTPKPGWAGVDMLGQVAGMLDAPVAIDTDVACAALAEARAGAGHGLDRLCYVTVGTGIGVGFFEHGHSVGGAGHPEVGHIRVPRAPGDESFAGVCPYHGDCLEGLASGPALAARWGGGAEHLPEDHVAWHQQAHYIACLCINLTYTARPQRIVLGGGVMERAGLYDRVRTRFAELMGGYAPDRWSGDPASYIAVPMLREPSPGVAGALMLAQKVSIGAG